MIELKRAGVRAAFTRLRAAALKGIAPQMILEDISLWIGRGESFAVFGDNYSGKIALLRLIAGHIRADAGECTLRGSVASSIEGYDRLIESETGETNALLELKDAAKVCEAERLFAGGELFRRPVREYTKSERARLGMSIALGAKPDVLVISGRLERLERQFMEQYSIEIRTMTLKGMTLIMDCASLERLSRLCESAIWIKSGRLHRIGSFEEIALNYRAFGIKDLGRVAFSKELAPKLGGNVKRKKSGLLENAARLLKRLYNRNCE